MSEDKEVYTTRTGWVPVINYEADVAELSGVAALAKSLSKAQGEIEGASKGKVNPAFKSKYADLASVWDAVREPLSKNGLSVIQLPCPAPTGQVGLVTTLLHESGQSISQVFYAPVRNASNIQDVGSALTYARRYALMAVCGVAPEDDDGNAAAGKTPAVAPRQIDTAAVKAQLETSFAAAETVDAKKDVYTKVRQSELPEPQKSELLTRMGDIIKAATATTKGKSK